MPLNLCEFTFQRPRARSAACSILISLILQICNVVPRRERQTGAVTARPRAAGQHPFASHWPFLHSCHLPKWSDAAANLIPMSPPLTPSHLFRPRQVRGFCASGPRESSHAQGHLGLNLVRFHIVNDAAIPAHSPLHFTSHSALLIELRHDTSVPFGPGPKPATYPPLGVRRRAAIRRALRPGELAADSRNPDRTS